MCTAHRRRGYATEAARALMDFVLGDFIERNPLREPAWFRAMGVLDCER